MHIVFSADDNYAQHLGVTLASLLRNLPPASSPQIHIIDGGLSQASKDKIATLQTIAPFDVHYVPVSLADFSDYPLNAAHITIATYFRLKIPELLPHLDRVLYLDIDMVIDGDVTPLWQTPLAPDQWIGAVAEIGMQGPFLATIGMAQDDFYLNGGVLLMDLQALRKAEFGRQCVAFVQHYRDAIRFVDQDVLNHVCNHHVAWLPPQYNVTYGLTDKAHKLDRYASPYTVTALEAALQKPVIIHYTGGLKPWRFGCRHPLAGRYWYYLRLTPWADYRIPDMTFKTISSFLLFKLRRSWRRLLGT